MVTLKWQETEDKDKATKIKVAIERNQGYCPCSIQKNEDTKCVCKTMRTGGGCHCELFEYLEEPLSEGV